MSWILENYQIILQWIGGIVACASIIVGLTPSTKDNEVLDVIIKFLDKFSVLQTKDNAEKLK